MYNIIIPTVETIYRVCPFSLGVHGATVCQAVLQGLQSLLQLCLLGRHEVQLVVQPLLVKPYCCYTFIQVHYLLTILDQQLVPSQAFTWVAWLPGASISAHIQ